MRAASLGWRNRNIEHARASASKWHAENRDERRESQKRWKAANPDRVKAMARRCYLKDPTKPRAQQEAWRKNNPEKFKAGRDRYVEGNRESIYAGIRNRRARKKAGGTHTAADIADLARKQDSKCVYCAVAISSRSWHVDHRQPIARGGSNDPSNLQLLCQPCNNRKWAHDPDEFERRIGISR